MENWVLEITDQLNTMTTEETSRKQKHCIYEVPTFISKLNPNVYTPQTVSFGPYHHGKEHLKPMEEHKKRALLHFLRRSKMSLKCIVQSFSEVVEDLKDAYDSLDESWMESGKFLKLMIMDGCFMLEIFRAVDYDENDPIFGKHGKLYIMPFIKSDMLLIENQLPMMVLYKLMEIYGEENSQKVEDSINRQVLSFCNPVNTFKNMGKCLHVLDAFRKSLFSIMDNSAFNDNNDLTREDDEFGPDPGVTPSTRELNKGKCLRVLDAFRKSPFSNMGKCLHFLDAFRKSLLKSEQKQQSDYGDFGNIPMPSARELNDAGIRFKPTINDCLVDISFENGVLRLPKLLIDDGTESMFLNMIAFECCHVGAGNQVISYICFMDELIDDELDINLLQTRRIIQNFTGSDKEAANLFNTMSKNLTIDDASSIHEVRTKINKYCNRMRHRWRANLMHRFHTYFTNPWTLISVLAAVFLFALTITQTVYTILDYYNN